MRTQLMCSSSQGDQPFNITWFKDGVPIQSMATEEDISKKTKLEYNSINNKPHGSHLTINNYAPFSSILSIHNVTSHHNGNYTCRVSNTAGSVEYTALLSVSGNLKSNVFECLLEHFQYSPLLFTVFLFDTNIILLFQRNKGQMKYKKVNSKTKYNIALKLLFPFEIFIEK